MCIGLRLVDPAMAAKTIGKLSVILGFWDFSVYAQRVAESDSGEGWVGLSGLYTVIRVNFRS